MTNFHNKVVWITGASSGIGEELAYAFSGNGARLVLSARRSSELERVRNACANPENVFILPLDLEKQEEFPVLVSKVILQFGSIDVLVNNGGISQRANASETPMEVDRRIMEVNYFGSIALTKAVLPQMKLQGGGTIIVMSSIAGKFGFYLRSAYSAAKHALHGFYESLRLEEEKNGIRVTIVCPGKINTNISLNALSKDGNAHGVMDHNQETGMPADECAKVILRGVSAGKEELFVGGKELKAVTLKRFFPRLFGKIIRKQKAT
ncbi:MAG: SDR family oxidoreductase [Flavobacteriales bacterium]